MYYNLSPRMSRISQVDLSKLPGKNYDMNDHKHINLAANFQVPCLGGKSIHLSSDKERCTH